MAGPGEQWVLAEYGQQHMLHSVCCVQASSPLFAHYALAFLLLPSPSHCWSPTLPLLAIYPIIHNPTSVLTNKPSTIPSKLFYPCVPGQPSRLDCTLILFIESSTWINTVHFSWASRVLHSLHRTEHLTVFPVPQQSYENLEEKNSLLSSSASLPSVCNVAPYFCWVIMIYLLMVWSE